MLSADIETMLPDAASNHRSIPPRQPHILSRGTHSGSSEFASLAACCLERMGTRYESVFPLPVSAARTTSEPSKIGGTPISCRYTRQCHDDSQRMH